jgi:hypothetical protein
MIGSVIVALLTQVTVAAAPAAREHPFLICTRDQFPELRQRAQREPWASMKQNALAIVAEAPEQLGDKPVRLQRQLGALALAYIVQPAKRAAHAKRVHQRIVEDLAAVAFTEKTQWHGVVPTMGAAFTATIALDITQGEMSPEKIDQCERTLEKQINKINEGGPWTLARLGTHGTWAIYTGQRTTPDDVFYQRYTSQITDDGVTTVAADYAWARLVSTDDRPQKTGYADVLEFTGIDQRYYDHPRLEKFYRWLYSGSITPARQVHALGDFIPSPYDAGSDEPELPNAALAYRTGRFDRLAGRYRAWALKGQKKPGHVLAYVLQQRRHEPKVPTSQLYFDGGAFFREPADSPDALAAALYNITERAYWHTHQETNALSLSAYGARLLMNGGWMGARTRPPKRNNTLTLDAGSHDGRTGAGLETGLTSPRFDYAAGDSGDALPGEAHFTRHLLFVHSQDRAGGYFITVDDVRPDKGKRIHHYLHPSTDQKPEMRQPRKAYVARTNLFNRVKDTRLAIFYGRRPATVRRQLVPSEEGPSEKKDHYRLEAIYPTETDRMTSLVTVMFPFNDQHPKAQFTSRHNDKVTKVSVSHRKGVKDLLCQADQNAGEQSLGANVDFKGSLALVRQKANQIRFFFARESRQLRGRKQGFEATHPLTIHLCGTRGRISTDQRTTVTFRYPGLSGVRLEGERVTTNARGENAVQLTIEPGHNQSLTLLTSGHD